MPLDVRRWIDPLKDLLPAGAPLALATADQIRELSFGEVKKPDMINHVTHLPENGGLMCAKIFGPIKDDECLCGKYSKRGRWAAICEKCGVEVISASARATRIGHVELAVPVLHPWLIPFARDVLFDEDDLRYRLVVKEGTPELVQWSMHVLPILPPALRPVGDDVNELYRRVINRNNRLARLEELNAPSDIIYNERRMVQEAVEQLFDNENASKPVSVDERKLRSLGAKTIDVLKSTPDERIHLTCMGFVRPS